MVRKAKATFPVHTSGSDGRRLFIASLRAQYDAQLARDLLVRQKELHTHVTAFASDMEWDDVAGTLALGCRCGGMFCVSQQDLEDGVQIVVCSSCTMRLRIDL